MRHLASFVIRENGCDRFLFEHHAVLDRAILKLRLYCLIRN
ncbi:MAG: hypothetical protein QNJ70_18560 [Xenococcaceae cyanobacterium MO_207.B15]|nr:hypothetical protein [Xenococcaceae cyanobacterium MO_207.B15]